MASREASTSINSSDKNLPQSVEDQSIETVGLEPEQHGALARFFVETPRRPLPGVTQPWLYMGMLFATFPWSAARRRNELERDVVASMASS